MLEAHDLKKCVGTATASKKRKFLRDEGIIEKLQLCSMCKKTSLEHTR
jgi:hypothetical protein